MSETIQVKAVTINNFMNSALAFLNERCPVGTGNAVSRADVAKAGGLSEENDALISSLINANFFPGWKIRQGRDGGVCRVGEEPSRASKGDKFDGNWLSILQTCLNEHVSTNPKKPTTRDEIAYAMAALTKEPVLKLPNRISEALSLGLCPGFSSRRGAGIFRKSESSEAPAVSADATTAEPDNASASNADASTTDSVDVSASVVEAALSEQDASEQDASAQMSNDTVVTSEVQVDSQIADTSANDAEVFTELAVEVSAEVASDTATATEVATEVATESQPVPAETNTKKSRRSKK